ncbi:MAG TPA: hypothetical protein VFT82_00910 [Candidatus Paceibacterota bacterium]|nr:hypothetical protein [Candidatus Paceibacterota bacterium]
MKSNKKAILGVGRPKCGKATNLFVLARDHGGAYLDMGATLRGLKKRLKGDSTPEPRADEKFIEKLLSASGTSLTLESLKPLAEKPGLVVNDIIMPILRAWVHEHRNDQFLVLDGAPRDEYQARAILPFLKGNGFVNHTVWFSTPKEVCLARKDRGGREDEDPARLLSRMNDFDQITAKIRPILRQRTVFFEIDNSHIVPEETYRRIKIGLGLMPGRPHAHRASEPSPISPGFATLEPAG